MSVFYSCLRTPKYNTLAYERIFQQETFEIVTNLITPRALFYSICLQCSRDNGSDKVFQR